MALKDSFTEHPATVGETYTEHFSSAMGFSLSLFKAAFCCAVHAIFPFLFEKTGSECITSLHHRMVTNRSRLKTKESAADGEVVA
ncbi:MAG: DUF6356 family protein [Woeseiaceae bacterium]|nr:DUF6356 family protein [Woeseiaceae bacterium]